MTAAYSQLVLAGSLLGVLSLGLRRSGASLLARAAAAAGILAVLWGGAARPWEGLFFLGALPLLATMRSRDEVSPALLLAALLGMSVLASTRDLFLLFLGLELMSLPLYALIYRLGRSRRSLEAAIKYFFAGSTAGALFLFGMSVYYAAAGTLTLRPIAPASGPALQLAMTLMGCAALFKIGAFPMNFWLPDAYEGAPPELAAFMSTSVKAAGFFLLLRLTEFLPETGYLLWLLPALSAATMTVGNLLALRQDNIARLLAYSSISHVGYLLAGVWAGARLPAGAAHVSTVYLYLGAYLFMSTGAFMFLRAAGVKEVRQLRGLSARSPALAACWAALLLALAGLPPTGGFLAKLFVVLDLLRSGGVGLAVALALNSLLGLAYYFRLIRETFLEADGGGSACAGDPSICPGAIVGGCAAASVLLGLWLGQIV